jgi:putative transposase
MARRPRADHEGAVHHVIGRGNDRKPIYLDEEDFQRFLAKLLFLAAELGFEVLAFCLMPNHYHLLVRTGVVPLSRYMHRLLTAYAVYFNERWQTVGHPFQGRFKNRICRDDNDLRGLVRYVHLNPIKAKLVADVDEWRWSSHRSLVGLSGVPGASEFLMGLFENDVEVYRAFLRQKSVEPPTLEELAKETGLSSERSIAREVVGTRRQFAGRALECGYRRSDVARFLGMTRGGIAYLLRDVEKPYTVRPDPNA